MDTFWAIFGLAALLGGAFWIHAGFGVLVIGLLILKAME
jgi:hypothetical protein